MKLLAEEKGYTMVAVMVTAVILTVIIGAVSTLALADLRQGKIWRDQTAAFYLAESGINYVLYQLNEAKVNYPSRIYPTDQPNVTSTGIFDFGPGKSFAVWVKEEGGKLKLTARGKVDKISKIIEVALQPAGPRVFPPPAKGDIIETNPQDNEDPDYYDSGYAPPEIKVAMPQGSSEGKLDLSHTAKKTISGDHYYDRINLSNSAELTIEGPATIYVAGTISIKNNSVLKIKNQVTLVIKDDLEFDNSAKVLNQEGQVTFLVGKNLDIKNSSEIGQEDPTKLVIYLSTEADPQEYEVTISNSAVIVGGICAPKAKVELKNSAELTGALVGWEVDLNNNARVNYDKAMGDITLGGGGAWNYEGWKEY